MPSRTRLPLEWIAAVALALALVSQSALAIGAKAPKKPVLSVDEEDDQPKTPVVPDCGERICVGYTVFDKDSGLKRAVVEEKLSSNQWRIRYEDGGTATEMSSYLYTDRPYCSSVHCLGDIVIDVDTGFRRARIIGTMGGADDSWLLEYMEGSGRATELTSYLAKTTPGLCRGNFCVGDLVMDRDSGPAEATVIGIKQDGSYVLEYTTRGGRSTELESYLSLVRKSSVIIENNETNQLEQQGVIDRVVYEELRRRGKNHAEAVEEAMGPVWLSLGETDRFLQRLSQSVYAFDREYYLQLANLVRGPEQKLSHRNAFVSTALLPNLRAFGYAQIRERWIKTSVLRITETLARQRVEKLADLESTATTRRLAVQMLGISLTTGMSQMNDSQRAAASVLVKSLSELAASPLRYREMESFFRWSGDLERLLMELSHNLYLQSRAATDMALLEFLRNG